MRSLRELELVASLVAAGLNDSEISRRTGIPRRTICDWRRGKAPRPREVGVSAPCKHDPDELPHASYAYLLGAYLGDGYIVHTRRGVYRLRVACDLLHLNIAVGIARAVQAVRGRPAALQPRTHSRALDVSSYWKHWPCLFPQHGPGVKHSRPIVLVDWQQQIVDAHPDQLLRGLIHSDGCRGINRIRHPGKTYEYPRYEFSNRSADIRRIFCDACDQLGVQWRVMTPFVISIARRASVAKLDTFIGPKR